MAEHIDFSLLVFSKKCARTRDFVESLFRITECLHIPEQVDILYGDGSWLEGLRWSEAKWLFTSAGEKEIVFVRPWKSGPLSCLGSSLSYECGRNRSLFDISIPLEHIRQESLSRVESWLIKLFCLGRQLGPCVLTGASEVSLSLEIQTEASAVEKAMDNWFNALWIVASRTAMSDLGHDYEIAHCFLHYALLRNTTALNWLSLV